MDTLPIIEANLEYIFSTNNEDVRIIIAPHIYKILYNEFYISDVERVKYKENK